jgi:VanZ family protein
MLLYINKMVIFFKFIFYSSLVFLILISIYPGSLIGYFLYNDLGKQPALFQNYFGSSINHFLCYSIISFIGFISHKRKVDLFYLLFFLAIILEIIQFIIPNRSLQLNDLIANILGVIVAYYIIKIYLYFNKL